MTTPAEQIAAFVAAHPGEWSNIDRRSYGGAMAALRLPFGWLALRPFPGFASVTASRSAATDHDFCADDEPDVPLLRQAVVCVADLLQAHGGDVEALPAWLIDPVRRELRRRAGDLLTLAGFSPDDVVTAAETLDEALCKRAPVPLDASAIVGTLMSQGMSCRWVLGEPLILVGDFAYLRDDLESVPVDDFAAFTDKHGAGRIIGDDKAKAPKVPGYRPFMALTPEENSCPD